MYCSRKMGGECVAFPASLLDITLRIVICFTVWHAAWRGKRESSMATIMRSFAFWLGLVLLSGCTVQIVTYATTPPGYRTDREIYDYAAETYGRRLWLTRGEILAGDRAPSVQRAIGATSGYRYREWRCFAPRRTEVRFVVCTTEYRLENMLRAIHARQPYEELFVLKPYGSFGVFVPIYLVQ